MTGRELIEDEDGAPLPPELQPQEEEAPPKSKEYRVVHYHREDGICVAVVGEPGHKWVYAVILDSPIRMLKLPLEEQKHMRADPHLMAPEKAAKKMLAALGRLGITEGAKTFLQSVG